MRNCFTKFTNVFRSKSFDNQLEGNNNTNSNANTNLPSNSSQYENTPSGSSSTLSSKRLKKRSKSSLKSADKRHFENDYRNDRNSGRIGGIAGIAVDVDIDIVSGGADDFKNDGNGNGNEKKVPKSTTTKGTTTSDFNSSYNIDINYNNRNPTLEKIPFGGMSSSLYSPLQRNDLNETSKSNSLQRKSGKKYGKKAKEKQHQNQVVSVKPIDFEESNPKSQQENLEDPLLKPNESVKDADQVNQNEKVTELFDSSIGPTFDQNGPGIAKTPEEIEYEKVIAAESVDVMTPLPSKNKHLTFNKTVQPKIVEIFKNMDSDTMRINNITKEDQKELIRRFDNQQNRRHSRGNKSYKYHSNTSSNMLAKSLDGDSSDTEVELRRPNLSEHRMILNTSSGLYERRQPKGPKLKLVVRAQTNPPASSAGAARKSSSGDYHHERNLMDLKYPTLLPPNPQLKALLIFPKADNVCEVIKTACHRHQFEPTQVKPMETAIEHLHKSTNASECYHLIIIDARSTKALDAEHLTRSIRHTNGHHFTTIVAVVKKNFFEKDDALIALLDAGVNRCMAETTNVTACGIEIKQVLHSIVRPHNVMATQQALYTALHRLKEVLIITDDVLRIQYANKSAERLLNMRLDEIISRPLADIFVSDVSSINSHGKSIKEFDGILTVKRKNQDGVPMHVRVVPVACIGSTPTHFIFNFDLPVGQTDFIATLPQPKEAPRGSLHSVRRGSFDVRSIASDGLRRTSLAKLTSLPLEAPITKIINLLSQVQENSSSEEARLIDRVMEFLKREGLYSPQMKDLRPDDPIATDLIGALLTNPVVYSSRRSSNDSIIRASGGRAGPILPTKMKVKGVSFKQRKFNLKSTTAISELLDESLFWDFDIFRLEEITEYRPLLYLGMELFRKFDVFTTLDVEENVCRNWLAVMEENYHKDNSYHNSTHAADVAQAAAVFLSQLATKEMGLDHMDEATILIAAIAHDVDHPGRSSAFLSNSGSPLAILYNDLTVLESHHAAFTFKLTLSDEKWNIFKNLDRDSYKSARSVIIDMILATEMTRHFEHLAKFVSIFGTDIDPKEAVFSDEESSILMRRMLIKVADVSNPSRPTSFCIEWASRIAEEYFMQTDEEKANALPIVMPMFDRQSCSIPKSQIGFLEYIVQDMVHAWDCFIEMPELITHMHTNLAQWKKFEEQGIKTLADIKAKVPLHHHPVRKTSCK